MSMHIHHVCIILFCNIYTYYKFILFVRLTILICQLFLYVLKHEVVVIMLEFHNMALYVPGVGHAHIAIPCTTQLI